MGYSLASLDLHNGGGSRSLGYHCFRIRPTCDLRDAMAGASLRAISRTIEIYAMQIEQRFVNPDTPCCLILKRERQCPPS